MKNIIKSILNQSDFRVLVPPRSINYNYGGSFFGYPRRFTERFTDYIFPYLLQKSRELDISVENLSVLDVGCGWGPLAIAFTLHDRAMGAAKKGGQCRYLGIDIRKDAIDWLVAAYSEYSNIKFQHHEALTNLDYVGAAKDGTSTLGVSSGSETQFNIPLGFTHNLQWSSSVFTHLTPQACREALKTIRRSCSKDSMQVNTWLIIDDESRFSLSSKVADRELPYDFGEYLTYSKTNPLVCTCYKLEVIKKMYEDSRFEIVSIERGAWRGKYYNNDANHYQDIIVSRPMV